MSMPPIWDALLLRLVCVSTTRGIRGCRARLDLAFRGPCVCARRTAASIRCAEAKHRVLQIRVGALRGSGGNEQSDGVHVTFQGKTKLYASAPQSPALWQAWLKAAASVTVRVVCIELCPRAGQQTVRAACHVSQGLQAQAHCMPLPATSLGWQGRWGVDTWMQALPMLIIMLAVVNESSR